MTIFKFGGSNFQSKNAFDNFLQIVNQINSPTLIVISALGKTTRRLSEALKFAEIGELHSALSIVEKLNYISSNLITDLIEDNAIFADCNSNINGIFDEIINYIRNISIVREVTPRTKDKVLAFGEDISLIIFDSFLRYHNISFVSLDVRDIIITDSNFNAANPIHDKIKSNIITKISPLFNKTNIILTQGYIAQDENANTTTMGFESSNLTAILFAEFLDAKQITIWTDVEGVFNIDPNLYHNAVPIPHLSFYQAKLFARYGNKLFYPKMIESAKSNNINIIYKSLLNPNGKQTIISDKQIFDNTLFVFFDNFSTYRIHFSDNDNAASLLNEFSRNNHYQNIILKNNDFLSLMTERNDIDYFKNMKSTSLFLLYLINPNILNIYKIITKYSDLFINLDFRLMPVEDNVYVLTFKQTNNKDLNTILNILINTGD